MIEKTDSIIFDLDGTLWDSTASVAEAWQTAAKKTGLVSKPVSREDVVGITGKPYDEIYRILFPDLTPEQRNTLMKTCGEEELAHLKKVGGVPYKNLEKTLDYLSSKYRLFIVSNCQRGYIETFLDYYQLNQYVADCECFGSRNLPKAENIKEIIRRNQLQFPVYVGDTQGDYMASKENNLPFVYCKYGFGKVDGYDLALDKLDDLQNIF